MKQFPGEDDVGPVWPFVVTWLLVVGVSSLTWVGVVYLLMKAVESFR